jgi:hypothetical protein
VLHSWIERLPVPLVILPPHVIHRPWWLITTVHEVSHHIQHDLPSAAGASLLGEVGDELVAAVAAAGAPDGEQEAWRRWSAELFADAAAVVLAGTAFSWAVDELERRTDQGMVTSRHSYPPPVVRWAVLNELGRRVGIPADPIEFDPGLAFRAPGLVAFLGRVPQAATALLGTRLGQRTLGDVAASSGRWERRAWEWRAALCAPNAPAGVQHIDDARLCVAGGVLARRVLGGSGARVDPQLLASRLLEVLPECRPEGVRAAVGGAALAGTELADQMVADLFDDRLIDAELTTAGQRPW